MVGLMLILAWRIRCRVGDLNGGKVLRSLAPLVFSKNQVIRLIQVGLSSYKAFRVKTQARSIFGYNFFG